jgi:8-oxo-(d)GTP phosphatase
VEQHERIVLPLLKRPLVRAAGTVPWRAGDFGPEVLLAHRKRYDDWSIPKGKLELGEAFLDAAVRETQEETGTVGQIGAPLCGVAYQVFTGPKLVHYWLLLATGGEFVPNREVDEVRWVSLDEATRLATHQTDRVVLRSAAAHLERVGT